MRLLQKLFAAFAEGCVIKIERDGITEPNVISYGDAGVIMEVPRGTR